MRKWPGGKDRSWRPGKGGGGVENRSVTLSRKRTQPDGRGGCYPRVRGEHRQAVTLAGKTGLEHDDCWIARGQKRAGSGPWVGRNRRKKSYCKKRMSCEAKSLPSEDESTKWSGPMFDRSCRRRHIVRWSPRGCRVVGVGKRSPQRFRCLYSSLLRFAAWAQGWHYSKGTA